jgi:hypothetical protein
LKVAVTTDDPVGKRCAAFSIEADVRRYTLKNVDTPNYFCAIEFAELTRVALTDRPAHPSALCHERIPALIPLDLSERIGRLIKMVERERLRLRMGGSLGNTV